MATGIPDCLVQRKKLLLSHDKEAFSGNTELYKYECLLKSTVCIFGRVCTISINTCILMMLGTCTLLLKQNTQVHIMFILFMSILGGFVTNLGCYLCRRNSNHSWCSLERAIMIDHRKTHKTLSYIPVMTVIDSQVCIFFIFSPNEQRARGGGGGGALPDFFFFFFSLFSRPRAGLATV